MTVCWQHLQSFTNLRQLVLSKSPNFSDAFTNPFHKLGSLDISFNGFISTEIVEKIVECCPKILTLSLRSCDVQLEVLAVLGRLNLEKLDVRGISCNGMSVMSGF